MGNVRDVHANLDLPVTQVFEMERVVKFFGPIGIDCERLFLTEVTAVCKDLFGLVGDRPVFVADILDNSIRKVIRAEVVVAK